MNEKQELTMIKNYIIAIMQEHENNERMQTLAKQCFEVIDLLEHGQSLERMQLKITKHNGKMENLQSLSTYKMFSNTCKALSKNENTICSHCYVDKTFEYASQTRLSTIYNTLLLKYKPLNKRQLPIINDLYFRFESFSDLQSLQHLENLYAIARANPKTQFALWTKNLPMILKLKCPKNVNLIISNTFMNCDMANVEWLIETIKKVTTCKHVKVFSVYDKQHIGDMQNCAKKCIGCLECYKAKSNVTQIYELLK